MPLHVVAHGHGPRVILVHGAMDRGASFLRAMRQIDDLQTVAFDRRGYGRSQPDLANLPDGPSVQTNVDDLLGLIGDEPAAVVGHSYGGVVALAAAAHHPGRVPAVGAFEPPLSWMDWWPTSTAGGAALGAAQAEDAAEAFLRRMLGDDRWEALPARTRAARRAEGPALVAELGRLRKPPPPFVPEDITVPVVVGCGTRSRPHAMQGAHYLADTIPGAELRVFEDAAHGAHASHPAEFAAMIRRVAELGGAEPAG